MKICLISDSLGSGGAEKMVANLSVSLTNRGYDVWVVVMKDHIVYPYKGSLYNFGKTKKTKTRIKAFFEFKNFFKEQNFDAILDHRVRTVFVKEYLFSKLIFKNTKTVYCVHHYNLNLYFPLDKYPILSKLTLAKNSKIVSVSRVVKEKIYKHFKIQSELIYNYTLEKEASVKNTEAELNYRYIVAVGRLEKVKQFDILIKTYKKSKLPLNNIKLVILGEGDEKANLLKQINASNLENQVMLLGFKENVSSYIKNALALVMSSESEGFPMVLIEALALKTPLISFDCESGPSEIINHEVNGLLVENQNVGELKKALNRIVSDKILFKKIKENLNSNTNAFSEEEIINQWIVLLKSFL